MGSIKYAPLSTRFVRHEGFLRWGPLANLTGGMMVGEFWNEMAKQKSVQYGSEKRKIEGSVEPQRRRKMKFEKEKKNAVLAWLSGGQDQPDCHP